MASNDSSSDEDIQEAGNHSTDYYHTNITNCNIRKLHIGKKEVRNYYGPQQEQLRVEARSRDLQAYLKDWYEKDEEWLTVCPWMETMWNEGYLENQYVPLSIRVNKKNGKPGDDVELCEIIPISEGRKILIEGEAGNGKSTLARKLAYDWSVLEDGDNYLGVFKYLFLVPVRYVSDGDVLEHVLPELVEANIGSRDELVDLLKCESNKILFILDGLDEVIENRCSLLKNLYPSSTVIVTSRPVEYIRLKQNRKYFDSTFNVSGFKDESVKEFLRKTVDRYYDSFVDEDTQLTQEQCFQDLVDFVYKFSAKLQGLRTCPLYLCLLCFTFINKPNHKVPQSIGQLYNHMVEQLSLLCVNKINKNREKADSEICKALTSFGKFALHAILNDNITFSQKEVDSIEHWEYLLRMGFLFKERGRGLKKFNVFHLLHTTFLDYFAAYYISTLVDDSNSFKEELNTIIKIPQLVYAKSVVKEGHHPSLFVFFMCGILEERAHMFLNILLSNPTGYFSSLIDVCLLLEHCGPTYDNIACVMKTRIPETWNLHWLFERNFVPNEVDCNMLVRFLKHSPTYTKRLELHPFTLKCLLNKKECFNKVLNAIEGNASITQVSVLKDPKIDLVFAQDLMLPMYRQVFRAVVVMPNLAKFSLNLDLFIQNKELGKTCLSELCVVIKYARNIKALEFMETVFVESCVCEGFHKRPKIRGLQPKTKRPASNHLDAEHIAMLIQSLSDKQFIEKLSLPCIVASQESLHLLGNFIKKKPIRKLKLPNMQCCGGLEFIFDSLSQEGCRLEYLDFRGTSMSLADAQSLAEHLRSNQSLKRLSLARCFEKFETLAPILEGVSENAYLEKLNIASLCVKANDDQLEDLYRSCLGEKRDGRTSSLSCLILSGWKILVSQLETLHDLFQIVKESELKELCLSKVKVSLSFPVGENGQVIMKQLSEHLDMLQHISVIDLQSFRGLFFDPHSPDVYQTTSSIRREDSGFYSLSFEAEMNECDKLEGSKLEYIGLELIEKELNKNAKVIFSQVQLLVRENFA